MKFRFFYFPFIKLKVKSQNNRSKRVRYALPDFHTTFRGKMLSLDAASSFQTDHTQLVSQILSI
jgi:hypothetical protein